MIDLSDFDDDPFSPPPPIKDEKPEQIKQTMSKQDISGLSPSQLRAYYHAIGKNNTFITGPAGTGKSYLLDQIVTTLRDKGLTVYVTAMTGTATVVLNATKNTKATTLHSWAGVGRDLGKDTASKSLSKINDFTRQRWNQTDVLVIDEVSMLLPGAMDVLELLGRQIRGIPNKPFGGIQIIACGDFYQLPPVNENNDKQNNSSTVDHVHTYCFQTRSWEQVFGQKDMFVLQENFRQQDTKFQSILNTIRLGIVNEDVQTMMKERWNAVLDIPPGIQPTILSPHVKTVKEYNEKKLNELPGALHYYEAIFEDVHSSFSAKALATLIGQLKESHGLDNLSLKVGAAVMLTVNLSVDKGLINGTQGVVVGFTTNDPPMPIVLFSNGEQLPMSRYVRERDETKGKGIAKVIRASQIPLILAWAMTIHKSQSKTLKHVIVNLRGVFQTGMAYVALSRCTDVNGLSIVDYDEKSIRASRLVKKFYESITVTHNNDNKNHEPTSPQDDNNNTSPTSQKRKLKEEEDDDNEVKKQKYEKKSYNNQYTEESPF